MERCWAAVLIETAVQNTLSQRRQVLHPRHKSRIASYKSEATNEQLRRVGHNPPNMTRVKEFFRRTEKPSWLAIRAARHPLSALRAATSQISRSRLATRTL